jgi:zinc transport system ATP-binding protein
MCPLADASAAPILDVRGLSVAFDGVPVLEDVSFAVPAGASLAVIGPNGSGKTVLFRALLGAVPHTGTVRWAPGVRIGYVPQKLDIERDVPITGLDFLAARLAVERGAGDRPNIPDVLRLVGLSDETSRKPIGTISGGQFQRLLVAFALLGNPTVLLLDEPTAGIDQPGEERLNAMLYRLQQERGLTVLLISHELTIVHAYATHVLCLGSGPAFFGPPSILTPELLANLYRERVSVHTHSHAH